MSDILNYLNDINKLSFMFTYIGPLPMLKIYLKNTFRLELGS
jgi:hypothetical protein